MATIVLRSVKGSPLTNAEVDTNFNNINAEVQTKLAAADYTATDVITKIKSVAIATADINVNKLNGLSASSSNTVSTVVARDSNGDFSAGTITATTLIGNVTGNVVGNLTGTVSGNATNVNGVVSINNGGTGATTASTARTALGLGTISTQASSAVSITGGTITGITDLAIADGGTGASTVTQARTNLGLVIGSDIQPFSNELTGIAGAVSTGFYVRTGTASVVQRSIVVGGNGLTVSNGDGVSGNPTISLPTSATPTFASLTTTAAVNAASLSVSGASTLSGAVATGNITTTGTITATGNILGFYSDDRLKNKLGKIENALSKVNSLEGFYFEANQTALDLGYEAGKQIGVSAQSVQAVQPEVVHPSANPEYLTVDYARLVPLLIESIKELTAKVNELEAKLQ